MTQSLFYCSELSARSGERVFGTASTGEVWLLVEYPFAWGSRAMESSALSPAIKEHLAALLKTIPRSRLLFVKQDSVCRADFNFFVVRSRARNPYAVRLRLTDYKDLLDLNVAGVAAGDSAGGGEVTREPLLLVCTHGKRDRSCWRTSAGAPASRTPCRLASISCARRRGSSGWTNCDSPGASARAR
ncbi:MAG: hypothetical protein LC785_03875 [Acidobacteria bacterium]|nr:hypothetical protein [Acidobacteriota bacterium]